MNSKRERERERESERESGGEGRIEMIEDRIDPRPTMKWRSRLDNGGATCVYAHPFMTTSTTMTMRVMKGKEEEKKDKSERDKGWLYPAWE